MTQEPTERKPLCWRCFCAMEAARMPVKRREYGGTREKCARCGKLKPVEGDYCDPEGAPANNKRDPVIPDPR